MEMSRHNHPSVSILVFLALTLALWLALGVPGFGFLSKAWIPAIGWVACLLFACFVRQLSRFLGVDPATYGPVAALFGAAVPAFGAIVAAAALVAIRYGDPADGSGSGWGSSPALGALFVILALASFLPLRLLGNETLGAVGERPLGEPRRPVSSHPDAPRTAAELDALVNQHKDGGSASA
jgi:hypothetical protein